MALTPARVPSLACPVITPTESNPYQLNTMYHRFFLDTLSAIGGAASGDLSGNYPSPTVVKINGVLLGSTTATDGKLLIGNTASSSWISRSVSGDATLGTTGTLTLASTGVSAASYTVNGNALFTVDIKGRITTAANVTVGTVTSVTFTGDGTVLSSIPSSAVTTSGTLTASLNTQSANKILAGPTTGSAVVPTFRSLVGADLPNPSSSSLGGIQSLASTTSKWINTISTSGVPSATQPAFTDISGNISTSQMNNGTSASSSTFWRGDGTWASVSSSTGRWINTQYLISGTTYTPTAGTNTAKLRMIGAGGGGAGNGTGATSGGDGGDTTFTNGGTTYTAKGGKGANANGLPGKGGGTGTAPTTGITLNGSCGETGNPVAASIATGGAGAGSVMGGGAGSSGGGANGDSAGNNTGGGGAGAGPNGSFNGGSGGGSGGYTEGILTSVSGTYTYSIGTAGTSGAAGTGGEAGGSGGSGLIIIDEYS